VSLGVEEMARPKKRGGGKAASTPPEDERVAIAHLKGSIAYYEWLDAIHRDSGIPKTTIIRRAVAAWAKGRGYPPPPEL
jgi:hypothetical protein